MKVDKLVKNVYETIMASGMICQGDSVVVGVSGGADSVCLLSVLKNLQMSMALQLTAVHIHHGLRGEAADRDRDFVTALCEDMQIPCVCFQADIRAMAREQHLSEEEAGRKYRYDCFEEVRQERQASKIAVAHHRDDLADSAAESFQGKWPERIIRYSDDARLYCSAFAWCRTGGYRSVSRTAGNVLPE